MYQVVHVPEWYSGGPCTARMVLWWEAMLGQSSLGSRVYRDAPDLPHASYLPESSPTWYLAARRNLSDHFTPTSVVCLSEAQGGHSAFAATQKSWHDRRVEAWSGAAVLRLSFDDDTLKPLCVTCLSRIFIRTPPNEAHVLPTYYSDDGEWCLFNVDGQWWVDRAETTNFRAMGFVHSTDGALVPENVTASWQVHGTANSTSTWHIVPSLKAHPSARALVEWTAWQCCVLEACRRALCVLLFLGLAIFDLVCVVACVTVIATSMATVTVRSRSLFDAAHPVHWPNPLPEHASTRHAPAAFVCPITFNVMRQPATTPHGTTYDYDALVSWIDAHHRYPSGEAPGRLERVFLTPNLALRGLIEDWLAEAE